MISVIYPIGRGSVWNNNEIKYSLRSVEKHLSGVKNVFIIGEKPAFLTNVEHIPVTDTHKVPDMNILNKIVTACNTSKVTDTFLFLNDDHYLLADYEAKEFPYYYSGTIQDYIRKRGNDGYGRRSRNTMDSLWNRGLPIKYFDTHYPMLINKKDFIKHVFNAIDPKKPDGFILKSLYANGLKIEGTQIEDCKSNTPTLKPKPCFSSQARVSTNVAEYLKAKFPNKSRYEI